MKKLICDFAGWFKIDVDEVKLTDVSGEEAVTKTAAEWLEERGNINGLILDSFGAANLAATDGEFGELELSIEDE